MIKIDIEGAERQIFQNCEEDLLKVHNMFVEYHIFKHLNQSLNELLSVISNSGFRYKIFNLNDGVQKAPVMNESYHAGMDVQLNIFCSRT